MAVRGLRLEIEGRLWSKDEDETDFSLRFPLYFTAFSFP